MQLSENTKFSTLLWVSHFLTDSLAAFVLTTISINILSANNFFIDKYLGFEITWYILTYNFLAFFLQIFVWYFLDKIQDNSDFFIVSRYIVITSILFYVVWILALQLSYILSIVLVWIWSCLFHIWSGSITLVSDTKKATNLWIFASWWVLWLSFWGFMWILFPQMVPLVIITVIAIGVLLYKNKSYKIDTNSRNNLVNLSDSIKWFLPIIILILWLLLVFRSAVWTNFQIEFSLDKWILLYLAIAAFLWKISGWFLLDSAVFKNSYFIWIWIISVWMILLYSFLLQELPILLLWIFGIQIFISPITITLHNLISKKRGEIIWFIFWMSLVLGYLVLFF